MLTRKKDNHNWIFWLTLFILFCVGVYALKSVLLPFVTGIIIGYLLDPWASYFECKGLNRTVATLLVLFLVVIFLVPALIILFSIIDEQVGRFLETLPQYIGAFIKKIEPVIQELQSSFPNLEADKIKTYLRENMANGLKIIGSVIRSVISSGFAFFNLMSLLLITPVVAFYMLRDWDKFIAKVDSLLPVKSQESIREQAREIDCTLAGFIRGQSSVCLILGTYYSLGLYFVGLELGVLVGFVAGIISFIPYVGSILGFTVSIAIAFAQFNSWEPILQVVAVFLIGQFIEGNFLTPKLVGENVGLHPVWVMFALLAGGVLLGFLGLMIAVPVAAVIGVLIRHAIINYKQSDLYLE